MQGSGEIEILLVEDNSQDAELVMRTLAKNSLSNSVVWLKDGALALDYIYKLSKNNNPVIPKLILLDLRLPKVDGFEVLKKIKSDELTSKIPVVVLTSSKEDRDIVESYKLGVNSYVAKPVIYDEFVKVIHQLGLYWLIVNKAPKA